VEHPPKLFDQGYCEQSYLMSRSTTHLVNGGQVRDDEADISMDPLYLVELDRGLKLRENSNSWHLSV
jgi:hypothetical protein